MAMATGRLVVEVVMGPAFGHDHALSAEAAAQIPTVPR